MKKGILSFILLCSILILNAQSVKIDSNSIKLQKRIEKLEKEIISQGNEIKILNERKDYYQNTLSDQTTRFSIIIGAIISLIGLITFVGYKSEIKKNRASFEKLLEIAVNEQKEFKQRVFKLLIKTYKSSANNNTMISEEFSRLDLHIGSFIHKLISAKNLNDCYDVVLTLEMENDKKIKELNDCKDSLLVNLFDAQEVFSNNIRNDLKNTLIIKDREKEIYFYLNEIAKSELSEVRDEISKIRADLLRFKPTMPNT